MRLFDDRYVTMTRGDSVSFNMELDGIDELDTAYLTCRKNHTEGPVFQKSIGNGITKQVDGLYVVRIAPEDTEGLQVGSRFRLPNSWSYHCHRWLRCLSTPSRR